MKNKITWEDLERKDIAIHTPTEDIMRLVVNTGIKMLNIEDALYDDCNNGHTFYLVKENTCIRFYKNEGLWGLGSKQFYRDSDYEIVEYEDVKHLFEDYVDTINQEM